jgi:hypothetical protein
VNKEGESLKEELIKLFKLFIIACVVDNEILEQ